MKSIMLFFLTTNIFAMQPSFEDGKNTAEFMKEEVGKGVRPNRKDVPQYNDGVYINKDELSHSFNHLKNSEYGMDLIDIHKTRKPYIVDETEQFMQRSEDAHKHPERAFEQTEEIQERDDYSIETCEEYPQEEYFVKARKNKKRYVYLDKAPYIVAGQNCSNHGYLTVRAEIIDESDDLFREDGAFQDIPHVSTNHWGGAYIDEVYRVNGVNVTLDFARKKLIGGGE